MHKKGLAVAIILLFIGMSIPSTGNVVEKKSTPIFYDGNILYVGGSGTGNYSKIQDAIDNASNGDTVFVYNGNYVENVLVDKSINLVGENRDTTVIDGGGNGDVVKITAYGVLISGFSIRNGDYNNWPYASLRVESSNNSIQNCKIFASKNGIFLNNSDNNQIFSNMLFSNDISGLYLHGSSNNSISDIITYSNGFYGIAIYTSSNNVVTNCSTADGIILKHTSNSSIINCHCYDGVPESNGVVISHSKDNRVEGCNINDTTYGLVIQSGSQNNTITKCNILKNGFGIRISNSNKNNIYINNFFNNTQNSFDQCDNTWYKGYLSGGNYWDDYAGTDFYHGPGQNELGRDWRGDTPYNISGGSNQDRYPLILPYESECPFAIIEHPSDGLITSEHNVTIIGYITDNVGLVKSGTSHSWDYVATTNECLHDELIPHLDFEFVIELKPGRNGIGIHATDPSNNKGHDSVWVFYYPDIVYVDDDYNSSTQGWQQYCFNLIQDGVDVVAESGTVYVYNGTYYENVIVDKSINLIGEDKNTTIIDGGGIGDVVVIHDDFVKISGFTIQNGAGAPGKYAGVHITSRNNEISHNIITQNNKDGIFVNGGSHNTICSNIITNNDESEGIIIRRANYNNIYKNDISSNVGGIEIYRSSNNSIYENNITANQHSITLYYSSNNSIVENDIIDNYQGIYLFYSSQEFGFSSYNIISENKIKNNLRKGIYLYDTFSNTISDNDISGNLCGIELFHSNYTTILNNNVYDNLYGIFLNDTINRNHNNLVYHNNLINNNYQAKDNGDNTWNDDYPSCGNYWDDYRDEDNDGDGVGDTPYDIYGEDNEDRYPLMEPYGMTKLTFSMSPGLFKFPGIIKNIGNKTAFNVQWKITIDGGIILVEREVSGYLPRPLLAGEEMKTHPPGIIFGLGRIVITVAVWADNAPLVSESIPGFLILFFIMI